MSDREVIDDAGRSWRFSVDARAIGRPKAWATTIDGQEYRIESRPLQGGWALILLDDEAIFTNERLIEKAIEFAQPYLPGGRQPAWIPTFEQVRGAAIGDSLSISTQAFDAWLAQHDQELIEAITSAARAMEDA